MFQMVNDLEEKINSKITDLTNLTTVNKGHPSENHESSKHIIPNGNLKIIMQKSNPFKSHSKTPSINSDELYVHMPNNPIKKSGSRKTKRKQKKKKRQ